MQFPRLRTGAVMQYPAARGLSFATQVARFVDGGEQRHRESAGGLRRWIVRFDLLSEAEMATIEGFFRSQQGAAGTFSFQDPSDAVTYTNCSFENDEAHLEFLGPQRARAMLVVRENRS